MALILIAAVAQNGVIGRNNSLPWHLPEDLKRFKALTTGHPVIMGRKTFDSILARLGKPLPGRRNLVISRSLGAVAEPAELFHEFDAAVAACPKDDDAYVIGGEAIYALALPRADRLELTEIHAAVEGDAHFPEYDRAGFTETARQQGMGSGTFGYDFVTYERRA